MNIYELSTNYDARQSFYGKAQVIEYDKGAKELMSYGTLVARIRDGKAEVFDTYSQTTFRHIKEFLLQNNFKAENKTQIIKDYSINKEEISEAEAKDQAEESIREQMEKGNTI